MAPWPWGAFATVMWLIVYIHQHPMIQTNVAESHPRSPIGFASFARMVLSAHHPDVDAIITLRKADTSPQPYCKHNM